MNHFLAGTRSQGQAIVVVLGIHWLTRDDRNYPTWLSRDFLRANSKRKLAFAYHLAISYLANEKGFEDFLARSALAELLQFSN